MAKYTVVALVIALLPSAFANASTMSLQERIVVGTRLQSVTPFVREKYLPASFVKELEKNMQSAQDKAELKKIQGSWSKTYSKDIGYRTMANGFEITYKKVAVVGVKITSLNPYTVQVNGGSEMIIRKDRFFADMSEALKDAGYDFSGKKKKSAFFSFILPEAYADTTTAKTVENSIFILGASTFTQKGDGSLASAMYVTEAMAMNGGLGVDKVSCKGNRMTGTYKQTSGSYGKSQDLSVDFLADRDKGVFMNFGDFHVIGKRVSSAATEICMGIDQGATIDLKKVDQMNAYGKHRSACLYLQAMRPAAGLQCSENGATAPSQDTLKAECAAMREVGLSSTFEFYSCKNADCSGEVTKLPAEVQNSRQLVAWQKFGPELEAAVRAVKVAFSSEVASGQIKEDGGKFSIVPPNKMSGSRTSEFNRLVAKIPAAPLEDKNGLYFDFGFAAKGFAGLLDCCYDSECKAKVYENGRLDLVPADGVQ